MEGKRGRGSRGKDEGERGRCFGLGFGLGFGFESVTTHLMYEYRYRGKYLKRWRCGCDLLKWGREVAKKASKKGEGMREM